MRAVLAGAVLMGLLSSAQAASPLDCSKFRKNTDGSWSPTEAVTVTGSNGTVTLDRGTSFGRADTALATVVADLLDQQCGQ